MSETTNEKTLALLESFRLPDMAPPTEFSKEDLADDIEGMQMAFQRVKMPSGGAVVFEMQTDDPERPEYVPTLTGIIIYHHPANAYWQDGETADESVPPSCSSNDGKTGIGIPGGLCEGCHLNAYQSGENGKAKACKNKRHVYLLRDGDYMPILLQLPPTSKNPFEKFVQQAFTFRGRASFGGLVELGLKKMDNGNLYSVVTSKKIGDFSGPKLAEVMEYAGSFKRKLKEMLAVHPEEPATEPLVYGDYAAAPAIGYPAGQQYEALEDLPFGPPMDAQPVEDLPFGPPAGEQEVEDLPFGPPPEAQPAVAVAYAAASQAVINGDLQQVPA